jgi:hypothetical protein
MNTTVPKNLVMLARMLERLERSNVAIDPAQYRSVVDHLAAELKAAPRDAGFDAVLETFPAAAELYENLNYQHAGLCRSPLDAALQAELAARSAIATAGAPAPQAGR